MLEKNICFLDLETTGVNTSVDRIVEISIIKTNKQLKEIDRFYALVNPLIPIPEEVIAIHGIDEDLLIKAKAKPFKEIAQSIIDFTDGCDLAGFNLFKFDLPLLVTEFTRCDMLFDYLTKRKFDMMTIFMRNNKRDLAAAYNFYTGKIHNTQHTAEGDVEATIEVFKKQIEVHDLNMTSEELEKYSNYDKEIVDLASKFTKDDKGVIYFNFGKNKNIPCLDDKAYLQWMAGQDFTPDVLFIVQSLLHNKKI
jgi:DNA polymerase-3 subunit epsilon